ncbi:hypothetical protein A979_08338 [Pseudomonas syringae BRIP34876]|nr:hypothetical protein A979_08338 [Pseudomonas syringae BRIP34876]
MIPLLSQLSDPLPKATILLAGQQANLTYRLWTLLSLLLDIFLDLGNQERKTCFFEGGRIATRLSSDIILAYKGIFRQAFRLVFLQALESCTIQIAGAHSLG